MSIGKCDICKYGQTVYCTSPNRASNCFETYPGTTEIEKRIRADERAKVIEILKNEMPYDICDGNEAVEEIERILNYHNEQENGNKNL